MRKFLQGKIHNATVTAADLNYEGSIAIDTDLLYAAGIDLNESVHVWNITNGERLETYTIAAPAGSGTVMINGAAARRVHPGDRVIVAAWTWLTGAEAGRHSPKIIVVDSSNRIKTS